MTLFTDGTNASRNEERLISHLLKQNVRYSLPWTLPLSDEQVAAATVKVGLALRNIEYDFSTETLTLFTWTRLVRTIWWCALHQVLNVLIDVVWWLHEMGTATRVGCQIVDDSRAPNLETGPLFSGSVSYTVKSETMEQWSRQGMPGVVCSPALHTPLHPGTVTYPWLQTRESDNYFRNFTFPIRSISSIISVCKPLYSLMNYKYSNFCTA